MNRHRGGMTVESVQGEGAAFGVYLPMARGDGRDQSAGATSPSPLST